MSLPISTPKRARLDKIELPLQRKTFAKDGFKEWLKYLKQKWERQRSAHRKAKTLGDQVSMQGKTMMEQMIVSTNERIRSHAWHIMQIAESGVLGVFNVFAVADNGMHRFELAVKRVFYIDDNFERAEKKFYRKVQKVLPRMRPSTILYEFSIDEKQFVTNLR
jgi:hypothetical protein